ncbi:peptidylprolyl isomerase [Ruminococcaceae bacterium OttesenSCG-928-L11]|nr:peptidylprolyl isomerase [Ruminococcaceae bacterium OttesenSCG-928-L11]
MILKMKKGIATLLVAGMIGLTISGCGSKAPEPLTVETAAAWEAESVASWHDTNLTKADYMYFYRTNQYEMEQQLLSAGYTEENLSTYWNDETSGAAQRESLKTQSLFQAKQFMTLYEMAVAAGAVVDEATATENSAYIDEIVAGLDEEPAKAAQAFLDTYGVTAEQMKALYIRMDYINAYLFDVSVNTAFTDEELKEEYDANVDLYEQVTVRHVLVLCDDNMTEEAQKEAKEKADDILARIEAGEPIGDLAKELSEDGGSVDNNGEYTFGRGRMVKEFEDWSFSAQPGDRGIVKTSYGYHVMEMMARLGFEDAKDTLTYQLGNVKAEELINEATAIAENGWADNNEAIDAIVPA